MALGVSTCWLSRSISDGAEIVRKISELGVKEVELDYRLSAKRVRQVLDACGKLDIKPVTIHAVSPAPENKKVKHDAEAFMLSADDEEDRRQAVRDVVSTLKLASDIGAKAVVVHSGAVRMEKVTLELQKLYDAGEINSEAGQRVVNNFKIERLRSRGGTFDNLLRSLDELSSIADRLSVNIGIENRYYLREYPGHEELAVIFLRMKGSPIKYWHDTGHAQAQENLGIVRHEAYLEDFSDMMIGMHIHDINGYTDHLPPPVGGNSGVNFNMVKKYLKPDTIRILELRDGIPFADAMRAVEWLKAEGVA